MIKKAKLYEIYGLILVLGGLFFQTFVYEPLNTLSNESMQYKLETKIDTIFCIVKDNYSKLHVMRQHSSSWSNPELHNNYQYAEDSKYTQKVTKQTNWARVISTSMFAMGSIFIIWSKWLEYRVINETIKTK